MRMRIQYHTMFNIEAQKLYLPQRFKAPHWERIERQGPHVFLDLIFRCKRVLRLIFRRLAFRWDSQQRREHSVQISANALLYKLSSL